MIQTARSALGVTALFLAVVLLSTFPAQLAAAPEGQMNFAAHVTLAPRWLDPAETESAITPFMVLYGIHDALVKPMPSGLTTPSLAESWTVSKDNLAYEFVLRNGVKFHNGDPVTADDVKFSFERYHGGAANSSRSA
jgi:peptide/nickel transport system substrate-binding protein